MGNARWDDSSWRSYSAASSTRTIEQNFSQRELHESLNPRNIEIRESCDSEANPFSTPIILGLDVTGSMGFIAQSLATTYLGKLIENILERKPVTDPHMMVMGIGDVAGHGYGRSHDRAPLQVSQFEADIRIAEQLAQVYIERGGCGNGSESYHLAWHFAANFTKTDCWDRHNRKGYIFTIGDEGVPPDLTADQLRYVYGKDMPAVSTRDILRAAQEKYNVYHLIVAEGDYCRGGVDRALNPWRNLLGENAVVLEDHTQLADIVCEIMLRNEQADPRILTEIDRVMDLS